MYLNDCHFPAQWFAIIIKIELLDSSLQAPYNNGINFKFIMLKITNIRLPFDHDDQAMMAEVAKTLHIHLRDIKELKVLKRSLDARKGKPLLRVYSLLLVVSNEETVLARHKSNPRVELAPDYSYSEPVLIKKSHLKPVIVGTGPAGLFAGLILAEAGLEPILIERGKRVTERAKDTYQFWQKGDLDPESNAQFGEGGAGTFSDGKLQTRVKDKNNRDRKVLESLVLSGAPEEILFDNKPHIGTANLIGIVKKLRERITDLGGEYMFSAKLDDLILEGNRLSGIILADGKELFSEYLILAIGHSARDTFQMLLQRGVNITPKPFSVGFRIEHPQQLINDSQYGKYSGHPDLGAADYQIAYRSSGGRTVYSFCMCPGGSVIAAASETGHLVTNGMSQYARNEINANSAIVVEVYPSDFENHPLGGIEFQRFWEKKAFLSGGENYFAPAQLVGDFLAGLPTETLRSVHPSYLPGVKLTNLRGLLPGYVSESIAEALVVFDQKITGFSLDDAVLTGVETRTSAPLRVLRDASHQSISVRGLFPAGEGSGYAGGIMSSALDGIKTAEKVIDGINGA